MSQPSLEQRVAQLETQMATLLQGTTGDLLAEPGRDEWKKTLGMFDNDAVMDEIIEETLKVREEDRQRTRP